MSSINRRSFLTGSSAMILGQTLAACTGSQNNRLTVRLLKNSIPVQLPGQFRQVLKQASAEIFSLDLSPEPQLQALYSLLETWKQTPASSQPRFSLPFLGNRSTHQADLITLGDAWLTAAIQKNLIQPLEVSRWQNWQNVPAQWQELVTRDQQGQVSRTGKVWGAPYRWGTTVIAYRADQFRRKGWPAPTDWRDLWRSELQGRLSLLDEAREVIGLTLKKLGQSYNSQDLSSVPSLKDELQALQQQVKFYSSTHYLQPLLLEDTDIAVGWSTDILPLTKTNPNIAVVVPSSGTRLWAELWVRPTGATEATLAYSDRWIDFLWQPETAQTLSILSNAASPVMANPKQPIPPELKHQNALLPAPDILQRSEFLYPLPEESLQQYRTLWQNIRQKTA